MLRTIIWFMYFWIYMIIVAPYAWFISKKSESERHEISAIAARKWASRLLSLAGAKVTVTGTCEIPKDQAVLFVSNHQGAFDIPLLIANLDRPFGFIAKEELEKLPFVSHWMKNLRCVFIKRGNPREAIKSINAGIELLKKGQSLMIFPEGTRSRDGNLLPFKPGSLKLATKSGVAVVPITIKGSRNLMKAGKWIIQPAEVTITIGAPIPASEVSTMDTQALCDQIESTIRSVLTMNIN